jgi:hypothetical protein
MKNAAPNKPIARYEFNGISNVFPVGYRTFPRREAARKFLA